MPSAYLSAYKAADLLTALFRVHIVVMDNRHVLPHYNSFIVHPDTKPVLALIRQLPAAMDQSGITAGMVQVVETQMLAKVKITVSKITISNNLSRPNRVNHEPIRVQIRPGENKKIRFSELVLAFVTESEFFYYLCKTYLTLFGDRIIVGPPVNFRSSFNNQIATT